MESTHEHDDHSGRLCGEIVEYDDAPDEYTLFPPDAAEEELVTTWVTARGDAFVDLEAMR